MPPLAMVALAPIRSETDERRLITVLFVDIVGSTPHADAHDQEAVSRVLVAFRDVAHQTMTRHGGRVEKYAGDAALAFFGDPIAHPDDAARAVSAGLELISRIQSNPTLSGVHVRVGVDSGTAFAARGPIDTGFLNGPVLNGAKRLEENAGVDAMLVGERAMRAASRAFSFSEPIYLRAKGKSELMTAYTVVGPRRTHGAARTFVGRVDELARLRLTWAAAFRSRRANMASIVAPPGAGKTRLMEAAIEAIRESVPSVRIAIADSPPSGEGVTFSALPAMLAQLSGLELDRPRADKSRLVTRWLEDIGIDDHRVVNAITGGIGGPIRDPLERRAVEVAWRKLIETLGQRAPVAVVVDDLQAWTEGFLDWLDYVTRAGGESMLFVLTATRPELLDRRTWGANRTRYLSLVLEPMSDEEITEVIRNRFGSSIPSNVVPNIVRRAEGNPLFAEEIGRSIVDRGQSVVDEGVIEAVGHLPDTVEGAVRARLDVLPQDEKRFLQLASVLGTVIPDSATAVVGGFSATVADLTARLAAKELLDPHPDGHRFRHATIRQVAYESLPYAERSRVHALLAKDMTDRENSPELIAHHFYEAYLAGQMAELPDLDLLRNEAIAWLRAAAESLQSSGANLEAWRRLRTASEIADSASLAPIYEQMGDTGVTGDKTVEAYEHALDHARASGMGDEDRFRIIAKMVSYETRWPGSIANRRSDDELRQMVGEGRALAARSTDERSRAMFFMALGFVPWWTAAPPTEEDIQEAEAAARESVAIADRLGDPNLRSAARDALASPAMDRGDWRRVLDLSATRVSFGEQLNLTERIDAFGMATWAAAIVGDLTEADRYSALGQSLVEAGQVPTSSLHVLAWRTYVQVLLGRWDEAVALAERTEDLWRQAEKWAARYSLRGFMAALDVARSRGSSVLAAHLEDVIRTINDQSGGTGDSPFVAAYVASDLESLMSSIAQRPDRVDAVERALSLSADVAFEPAAQRAREVVDWLERTGARIAEAQARRVIGVIQGDAKELRSALTLFEAADAKPYAARCACELGILTGDLTMFARGQQTLTGLGDDLQLTRYGARMRIPA